VGGGKLIVDFFFEHVILKSMGGFVVQFLQLGAEASSSEQSVSSFVSSKNGRAGVAGHWFHMNEVAVIVVKDEHDAIAGAGGSDEASSGISVNLACGGLASSIKEVRLESWRLGEHWIHVRDFKWIGCGIINWQGNWTGLSRAQVCSLLIEVALVHWDRVRGVLPNQSRGKRRPGGEASFIDGFAPRGEGRGS